MPTAPGGDPRIRAIVLTGFLGSGKTTVLRHILSSPDFADTAILINEFGETGIDHLLVGQIENIPVLLENGCICCSIRGDLSRAMRDLLARRQRGEMPAFSRLIVETTGLADPTPILATITGDLVLRRHLRLGNVVCTVDAVHVRRGLGQYGEMVKQVAVADRLLLTKTDLVPPEQAPQVLDALRLINPAAIAVVAPHGKVDPDVVVGCSPDDPDLRLVEVQRWSNTQSTIGTTPNSSHVHDVKTFVIRHQGPIDWNAFGLWFSLLSHRHGDRLLRVKGLLDIEGSVTPVAFHAVQHIIHQPEHLAAWPTAERMSCLVFIVNGLDGDRVRRSFSAFSRLGRIGERTASPGQAAAPDAARPARTRR